MNNPYLLSSLRKAPIIVGRIVAHVPEDRWDATPDPDRFSFREAVAHLADWDPILLARMQLTVSEPGAAIRGIDESLRAEEQGYRSTDPRDQARRFAERREALVEWLSGVGDTDWAKAAVHSERGLQTLADQAALLGSHDVYHIDQLLEFL